MASSSPAAVPPRSRLALIGLASAAAIAFALLASFRLGFAEHLPTALATNGARVLLGAAAGAALAMGGALRLAAGVERPLRELEILALSTGSAGGGFLLASGRVGPAAYGFFAMGALAGAALLWLLARTLQRPRRWTNLALAPLLLGMAGLAAVASTYGRATRDFRAPLTGWLLGDLDGATWASALAVALAVAVVLAWALRGDGTAAWPALGLGVGAAGPLAFVGAFAPLAVRALAPGASARALVAASAAAGAATVVAVDAGPRLLIGGYAFPWSVTAAVLAIPWFLAWNRARLRREAGPAGLAFEALEIALIAAVTWAVLSHGGMLVRLIRALT